MLPLNGQTAALLVAPYQGYFACVVSQKGCTDTTACHLLGAPNAVADYSIISHLYPNPSSTGSYYLELDKIYPNVQLEVRTINGQLVWEKSFSELKSTSIHLNKSSGVYMLYIKEGGRTHVKKLVRW